MNGGDDDRSRRRVAAAARGILSGRLRQTFWTLGHTFGAGAAGGIVVGAITVGPAVLAAALLPCQRGPRPCPLDGSPCPPGPCLIGPELGFLPWFGLAGLVLGLVVAWRSAPQGALSRNSALLLTLAVGVFVSLVMLRVYFQLRPIDLSFGI